MAYEILVIGSGDTEREVMAKAIIDRHVKLQKCEPVKVRARGLVVLFQEPVNPKVAEILKSNEAPLEYDCVFQLEQADIDQSDLILTIDSQQKERVLKNYQNVKNIYTLKELAGEDGAVLDPYGKDLIDYEYSYRELHRLLDRIIKDVINLQVKAMQTSEEEIQNEDSISE